MTPEQVLETYDETYAETYDQRYLLRADERLDEKTRFEIALIQGSTREVDAWLDVACGTGYFLRHARGHAQLRCAGLDLSPAMLARARAQNPDATFINADYRAPQPELEGRWGFVSCLWGAYSLQETVADIASLVRNLGRWTRPGGTCLMPVFDPEKLAARRDAGQLRAGMSVSEDGTVWSYREPGGKRHQNLLSPPVPVMEALFLEHFQKVERYAYPPGADGGGLVGLIARR